MKIGASELAKIFKSEIGFGLLGEFIECLTGYASSNSSEIINILEGLATTNRFSLSLQFLSEHERELCQQLFSDLDKSLSENGLNIDDRLQAVKQKYIHVTTT